MIAMLRRLFCVHHWEPVPDAYLMRAAQRLRKRCPRCGATHTVRAC